MAPQAIGQGADVKAMLAANPNAGLYYICTPNNPTGTVTSLADIQWLLDNKPAGSMVLVDEAYIHFSEAPSAVKLLGARKDLIVMRTFSKLFGMAGIRLGITFADPEVQKKLSLYNAVGGGISITAMACGAAVYNEDALIKARRNEMTANREETIAWLTKKGIEVQGGSHANMFMVNWKKPPRTCRWRCWPSVCRSAATGRSGRRPRASPWVRRRIWRISAPPWKRPTRPDPSTIHEGGGVGLTVRAPFPYGVQDAVLALRTSRRAGS
jgi:hypothetical protein